MAECKFTKWRCGDNELNELIETSEKALMGGENVLYFIFSRSGFTTKLLEAADIRTDLRIKLVSMDDIREWAESAPE